MKLYVERFSAELTANSVEHRTAPGDWIDASELNSRDDLRETIDGRTRAVSRLP